MATARSTDVLLILMAWDPPPSFLDNLQQVCPGIEVTIRRCGMYDTEPPNDISEETWKRVTVLFTWNCLPRKEQVPNLQYVQLLSAGCNQISGKPVFEETDISFCTSNGIHPPQIAEWVISTFLAFQHHLYIHWDSQKQETWVKPESDTDTEDAFGLRMGILGYGCIGRQCARLGKALGMDVHAYTLHEKPTAESRIDDSFTEPGLGDSAGEFPSKWFHGPDQLNDFLAGIDLLVVTLPLTDRTHGMIGEEQFNILSKKHAFLSNIARGPVVNTDALIKALNDGKLRGAALDVTDPEPLPAGHPLWKAKNVIITPHVSGNSTQYNDRVLKILTENLRRRATGGKLMNKVNRSLGY